MIRQSHKMVQTVGSAVGKRKTRDVKELVYSVFQNSSVWCIVKTLYSKDKYQAHGAVVEGYSRVYMYVLQDSLADACNASRRTVQLIVMSKPCPCAIVGVNVEQFKIM